MTSSRSLRLVVVDIPYQGALVFGPYLPSVIGAGAFFDFTNVICNPYTLSMQSLEGQVWKEIQVTPPGSGECCIDHGQTMPCEYTTVVSGSPPGGGSSGGTTGGGTECATPFTCSEQCSGELPGLLGNFCDLADANAVANNGCDVTCQ